MSRKSKTGDKLVASMRKSKFGAVARETVERPDAKKSTATRSNGSVANSKSSAAKSAMPKAATMASTNSPRENGFSHARRVWPD